MATDNAPKAPRVQGVPADGIAGLRQNWLGDIISGFIIFLIALPLSVGISLASGAPATAGLIAAIVGGIIGALIGGSYLTINGPAAGLIVIVLGAVMDLGQGDPMTGFRRMLGAAVLAGIIQVVLGVLRLGSLGVGVPGSVIHGMLTAIGVIIMAKQIHVGLGVVPTAKDPLGLIAEIPHSIQNMNPEVAFILMTSFLIIASHKLYKGKWTRFVPAPLIVAVTGVFLARMFDFDHEHLVMSHGMTFHSGPNLLLSLPENLARAIIFPDFSQILTLASLRWTISLALVAGIESLLSANAVDRLDPYGRTSNLDRELVTKGICNTICGLIGGLPIIAEIVRSSANVRNGAKTRWANFFHGLFIFAFLALFPALLHLIPLAALAAILVSVGYALAHPTQILHTAQIGKDHLAAFLTTLLVTLASDLLIGVFAGIFVELIFNFARGASLRHLFKVDVSEDRKPRQLTLRLQSPLVFTNFLALKKRLETTEKGLDVIVDLSAAPIVDHTSLDHLQRFTSESANTGRKVVVTFSDEHRPVSSHPLAARRRVRAAGGRNGQLS